MYTRVSISEQITGKSPDNELDKSQCTIWPEFPRAFSAVAQEVAWTPRPGHSRHTPRLGAQASSVITHRALNHARFINTLEILRVSISYVIMHGSDYQYSLTDWASRRCK